jgi:LPS-assembly protein
MKGGWVQSEMADNCLNRVTYKILFLVSLVAIHYLLLTHYCFAQEATTITSKTLEYDERTSTYTAKGSVKITIGEKIIEADEMSYDVETSVVVASGNVRYNDAEMVITASKMELNLKKETGKLYDTAILFKADNYHISGKSIEKRGENYYFAPEATFSTCDDAVPAWSFKGKDVDLLVGERLKAKHVSFYLKDVPALYSPYFLLPFHTDRETGFLIPAVDYSTLRGLHLNVPFFWVISESRDATAVLDMYSKRGIGEGLQYRYVEPEDLKGSWWLYHIRDTKLNKDFFEMRALHEERSQNDLGGFLSINFVNKNDFYRQFSPYLEIRTLRFLESTGEISLPLQSSRAYLLAQYWVDLEEEQSHPTQRLPEAGYVLYPAKVGPFWFSGTATVSNFWRNEDVFGQRLDVYPRILSEVGNEIVLTQAVGFRETAYSLHRAEEESLHREAFEYNVGVHTSLLKKYTSFTHIVEPSIGYTLITDSEESLPLFDSTELFKKTSRIEASLLNRFFYKGTEVAILRTTQPFDAELGDRPFLPFELEIGIKRPVSLRLDTAYDMNEGKLVSINSDLSFNVPGGTLSAGQRYDRLEDVVFYKAGFDLFPHKSWNVRGMIWYDDDAKEIRDVEINLKYSSQCWGVNFEYIKRPNDFSFSVMFDLKGISKGSKM